MRKWRTLPVKLRWKILHNEEKMSHYIIQGIFALTGLISLLAALLDWNWFFTAHNTQFIVQNVGRLQARLFYGVLGLLLIATAVFFMLETK